MLQSTLVLGNSSSGVLEAPIAGVPSIDVGDRQKGRVSEQIGITHCAADSLTIQETLCSLLSGEGGFADAISQPFDTETVSSRIVEIIESVDLAVLSNKLFRDH
jgi:UDP-N-acetylglucosamine 2-epimerase